MFVSDLATLDVSFEVALARLAALTGSGALTRVSADAYAADTSSGMRLLARSRFRDLITRPDPAVFAVRWETSDHDGEPFPVLDADLTLTPAGPGAALLQLAGVYRADPGEDGHDAPRRLSGPDRQDDHLGRCLRRVGAARDPGPARAGCSALAAAPADRDSEAAVPALGRAAPDQSRGIRPWRNRKARTMKHITGTALRSAACVVLLATGLALLAGKDDIRKFHRMRSM
jgi:hypothetical protein